MTELTRPAARHYDPYTRRKEPLMEFPNTLTPDLTTRAGRMLEAGDVRVTVTSLKSGEHITVRFKAFADNRNRQYKGDGKNWERCSLAEATHVFIEVPSEDWSDKVGTFYPKSQRFFADNNTDPARHWATCAAAHWLNGADAFHLATFQEEERCGRCGRTLTDPVSIERGIGPECYGKDTGSQHQKKVAPAPATGADPEELLEGIRGDYPPDDPNHVRQLLDHIAALDEDQLKKIRDTLNLWEDAAGTRRTADDALRR